MYGYFTPLRRCFSLSVTIFISEVFRRAVPDAPNESYKMCVCHDGESCI